MRAQGELLGPLLQGHLRRLDLAVLHLDVAVAQLEQPGLLGELLVGLLQLDGALLQLAGEELRLLQQLLGADVDHDRVEHDADRLHELVEEAEVHVGERRRTTPAR